MLWVWIMLQGKAICALAGYTLGQWRGATSSGLLVAWVVAVGFSFMGIG